MNKKRSYLFLSLLLCSLFISSFARADGLGRVFTSPDDRKKLDIIRQTEIRPEKVEVAELDEIVEPEEVKKEIIIRDDITLRGIVYRSDGKKSEWINDSNTFEGDFES